MLTSKIDAANTTIANKKAEITSLQTQVNGLTSKS
jgi:cell division protein FtsL